MGFISVIFIGLIVGTIAKLLTTLTSMWEWTRLSNTKTSPPGGVNLMALPRRFQKNLLQARAYLVLYWPDNDFENHLQLDAGVEPGNRTPGAWSRH